MLFNETHDLASGVMTDHVYEDTVRSYEFAKRRADAIIDAKWDVLASKIDTRGPGAPVVVFNPLGWTRSDVAEVDVGFGEGGVAGVDLTDPDGQAVPAQILESTRYGDGGLKTARVAFIARDVPALGYATYHVSPARASDAGDRSQSLRAGAGRPRRFRSRMNSTASRSTARPARSPACASSRATGRSCPGAATSCRASKTGATSGSSTRASTAAAGSP